MGRPQRWFRSVVVGLAVLAWLSLPAIVGAQAGSIGTTLNQCQNGTSGTGDCSGSAWVTGNLNPSNSLYREGDFVPMRSRITSLVAGHTYALRIGYDAVDKGLHAYDYLGSVDGSESAPGQQVVPCSGVGDTAGPHACGNGPSTFAVPEDTHTTFPSGSGQKPGELSAWGATLTGAAYVNPAPIVPGSGGTIEREIDVIFRAEGPTVVMAWGGHIASTLDWGAGRTFTSAGSGSSFHIRLLRAQENPPNGPVHSTGNQELSLQATALAPVPSSFTTQVDRSPVEVGSAVVDTATLGSTRGVTVSGVVHFFVCFSPTARPDCTFNGVEVGPGQVVVNPPGSTTGVASVQFIPNAPGSYCFRAEFVPSATGMYSPAAHTNLTTECFEAVITPPVLTVTKICIPSTDDGHFNLLLNAAVVLADAACGASAGPVTTTAGTHTVSETAGTGTDLADYTSEVGGNCTPNVGSSPPSGSITLANGDSATCTITNTRNGSGIVTGSLTVNKVCVPPSDGGLFDLNIDSLRFRDVPCGGSTGPVELQAGAHTVGEPDGGTDTSLADYTTVIGGDCAADGSVTVAAGGAATCTITNTRNPIPPATLTVTKLCVPGSDSRFTITINGNGVGTVGCGGSVGPEEVTPGQHTVGETGAGGTHLSDYLVVQGGACEADGTVFVGAGEHATCTITNIRKARPPLPPVTPLLTVEKVCVPSDDGGLFTLTIDGHASADQPCGGRLGPLVVSPGVHHVGETAGTRTSLSAYTSIIGGDCAADGSVTVAAGRSATCTITNVRKGENTAQITIVKQCRPRGVVARFQLNLDEHVFERMRCGDSSGPVVTSTGVHSVGEVAVNARPGLFRTTISGDCSPSGTITLTPGRRATCIVTNVRRAVRSGRRPAAACYRLTVARRMVSIGKRVRIVAHVRLHGRGIQGVRVFAVGPGVFDVHTTDRRGRALFLLGLRRAGILRLIILKPFACERPPPRNIGVLGVSQTFLTG
jgi:hypothetical protein